MAERKISPLVWVLGAVGVGSLIYAVMQPTTTFPTNTTIPPGAVLNTQWGQWTNTTGAPVWVNATGMLVSGAGNILGNIADIIEALKQGGSSGGSAADSGTGGGENMGGRKGIGAGIPGRYYNPQPGGIM